MLVAGLVALSVVVLGYVARASRTLFFEAPLAVSVFVRAAERFLGAGDVGGARALATAGRPAWLAIALEAALGEGEDGDAQGGRDSEIRLEETIAELHDSAEALLRPFRALASLSSSLGMLFAILSLNGVGGPSDGLLALQAGLVQSLALERALSCVAVGGATALVVLLSLGTLRRQARRLAEDLDRLASVVAASHPTERVPAGGFATREVLGEPLDRDGDSMLSSARLVSRAPGELSGERGVCGAEDGGSHRVTRYSDDQPPHDEEVGDR